MKKTIAGLIIIILIALLSYNYDSITGLMTRNWQLQGEGTYSETQININPIEARAREKISIEVIPGSEGAEKLMTMHTANGIKRDSSRAWCNVGYDSYDIRSPTKIVHSFKCSEPNTYEYLIPGSFKPGEFYIRIYDYSKAKKNKCNEKYGKEYEACAYAISWFKVLA